MALKCYSFALRLSAILSHSIPSRCDQYRSPQYFAVPWHIIALQYPGDSTSRLTLPLRCQAINTMPSLRSALSRYAIPQLSTAFHRLASPLHDLAHLCCTLPCLCLSVHLIASPCISVPLPRRVSRCFAFSVQCLTFPLRILHISMQRLALALLCFSVHYRCNSPLRLAFPLLRSPMPCHTSAFSSLRYNPLHFLYNAMPSRPRYSIAVQGQASAQRLVAIP